MREKVWRSRKRVAPASSPAAPASRVRRSRRLRSTLAAAPGLLVHAHSLPVTLVLFESEFSW
jgi:hypothetical protein